MSEWISVEERAPEGLCLVYLDQQQLSRHVHSADYRHKNARVIGERFERDCSGKVTHWMPLPEPPRSE